MNKKLLVTILITLVTTATVFSDKIFVTDGKRIVYIGMPIADAKKVLGEPKSNTKIGSNKSFSTFRAVYEGVEIEYDDRDNLPYSKGQVVNLLRLTGKSFQDQFGNSLGKTVKVPVNFDYSKVGSFTLSYHRDDQSQFVDWRPAEKAEYQEIVLGFRYWLENGKMSEFEIGIFSSDN